AQRLFDEASAIVDKISLLEMSDSAALENLELAKESMMRATTALENGEFAMAIIEGRNGVVFAQEAEKLHLVVVESDRDKANAAIARADRQLNFYKNLVLIPTDEASEIIVKVEQLIREARTSLENGEYIKASEKASVAFELATTLRSVDLRSEARAEITKARTALEEFEGSTVVLDPGIVELVSEAKEAIRSAESALAAGNSNIAIANAGKVDGLLLQARNLESVETINVARNRNVLLLSGVGIVGVIAIVLVSLFRRKGRKGDVDTGDEQLEVTEAISEEAEVDTYGEVNDYGEEPVEDISEGETEYGKIDDEVTGKIDDEVTGKIDDEVTGKIDDEVTGKIDDEVIVPLTEPTKPERKVAVRLERKVIRKRKVVPKKVSKRTAQKKTSRPRVAPEKKPITRRRSKSSGRRKKRG
ncbi:MAG: hypothetical protein IH932_03710, partial [Thaumarchaeota archaeon]|nr:hypothetical protein [Nitrososphaerota archaeon]